MSLALLSTDPIPLKHSAVSEEKYGSPYARRKSNGIAQATGPRGFLGVVEGGAGSMPVVVLEEGREVSGAGGGVLVGASVDLFLHSPYVKGKAERFIQTSLHKGE